MDVIRSLAQRPYRAGSLLMLSLAISLLLPGRFLEAQTTTTIHTAEGISHRYRTPSLNDRLEALGKSLDLNEAQKSAVRTILEQRLQELREARRPSASEGRAVVDRVRAIEDKAVERIRATLSEEQRRKYEPLGVRASASAGDKTVEGWLKEIGPR